jgi:hypothetical protein
VSTEHLPVSALQPLTLSELDRVKLLNRVDSKFIFNIRHLSSILEEISGDYSILEIENKRIFRYESLYFDTPDFLLYRHHHNGKPKRVKVRYRKYLDSGDVYFELKKKTRLGRTEKFRMRRPEISEQLDGAEIGFMEKHELQLGPLEGKMRIWFDRITLASKTSQERVTLDMNLLLLGGDKSHVFPSLIIAEVKQERYSRLSKIVEALRRRRIPELAISKYSLSVALLREVKSNAFKQKIIKLNKTIN